MKAKCPICHKETLWKGNEYRPFCSKRCKLIDLGEWIDEGYRIIGYINNNIEKQEWDKSKKL